MFEKIMTWQKKKILDDGSRLELPFISTNKNKITCKKTRKTKNEWQCTSTCWNGYDIQRYFWKVLALFYNHRLVIMFTWELLKISSSITNLYYEERKLQKCWYTSKAYSNECHILVFVLLHVRDWPKKSVIFRMKHRYNVFP